MNDYTIASVDSALKLLAIVADHPRLGLSELAERAELNTSRTFRLLTTLAAHRLIQRSGDPAIYTLGTQALVLGIAAGRQIDMATAAQAPLMRLAERFNEACQIRVRDGDESICIARVESSHVVRVHGTIGNRRPIHVGASGKLLLAYADDNEREHILTRDMRPFTKETRVDASALRQELDDIREKGYSLSRGEATSGVVAIAVPVLASATHALAALGMSIVATRFDEETLSDIIEQMRLASQEISQFIGHRHP
ncbi:IclR family transcriptional regulator [Caballeronia hypogeia]|uniref:IclR family transcriptional regulator n=1 Tax=Caballeronia hypogeia TaxID=1777140 RepID=A0A158A7R0_9BURK|nr:IclR family transcriptional regulator [Caballeronia hypogeia]SAK53838.1 IclR family transcriptional regulator [Caballeronia hypogeia]